MEPSNQILAIELNKDTAPQILGELEKRTSLRWQGTKLNPLAGVGYDYPDKARVIAVAPCGELRLYGFIDNSMQRFNDAESFISACVERHGNRRR